MLGVGAVVAATRLFVHRSSVHFACGRGTVRVGARCCFAPAPSGAWRGLEGVCPAPVVRVCAAPFVHTPRGCDVSPRDRVYVASTRVVLGPSDWEAEGRVHPRVIAPRAFAMDRFELTVGNVQDELPGATFAARFAGVDAARAASPLTFDEAQAVCAARGGRLPTDDEWVAAAAGERARRYPWGDTGAVCRRAAWGLASGPCGTGARFPDTVGVHPDGATPLGIEDLAGNVAEWVTRTDAPPCDSEAVPGADAGVDENARGCANRGAVRGGSFRTELATELRTWVQIAAISDTLDVAVGARCVYDVDPSKREREHASHKAQ